MKALRMQCIELLTEIEARLDFEDEMPPLDVELVINKISYMSQDVEHALETANYDKLLQSGLQVGIAVNLTSSIMQYESFFFFGDSVSFACHSCPQIIQLRFLLQSFYSYVHLNCGSRH